MCFTNKNKRIRKAKNNCWTKPSGDKWRSGEDSIGFSNKKSINSNGSRKQRRIRRSTKVHPESN
jgi:hypothetical protein